MRTATGLGPPAHPSRTARHFIYAGMASRSWSSSRHSPGCSSRASAGQVDLLARPSVWIPAHISFHRFVDLTLGSSPDDSQAEELPGGHVNSLLIASVTTFVGSSVGTVAAYAFSRLRFPGRGWLILAFMAHVPCCRRSR